MCYHERLVFECSCTSKSVYPCPDREHKERNASGHWVHVHRATHICPYYEAEQLHISIECEQCSLFKGGGWQYSRDYRVFVDEHAARHSSLLGTPPKYSIFLQPTVGNFSGQWYMKLGQELKKRAINHHGVRLRRAEEFEVIREEEFDRDGGLHGFHGLATANIHDAAMGDSYRPQAYNNNAVYTNTIDSRAAFANPLPCTWQLSDEAAANGKKIADASAARAFADREASIARITASMAETAARNRNYAQQYGNNTRGRGYWPEGSVEALESHLRQVQKPTFSLPFRPVSATNASAENVRPDCGGSDASRKRRSDDDDDEAVPSKRVRNDSGQDFISALFGRPSVKPGSEI